jgi:hypothetical protein
MTVEQLDIFRLIGNVLVCLSAAIATTSVILHARVPWWRSEMGRHLMAYTATIAAVLDLAVIRMLIGDSWWFALLRLVVFSLVPAVTAWRVWLQIKAHRDDRAERTRDDVR